MDLLDDLIGLIQKRPNMFFKDVNLTYLSIYLSGFYYCKQSLDGVLGYEKLFFEQFSYFVFQKLGKSGDVHSWEDYLKEEENGWEKFFEFYSEFRKTD